MPIVPQNAATTPAKNRLKQPSAWQTPSNCQLFLDNLYQIQFSDCSALPKLDCNLCPTLTAHSEPLPFSELAETRVQASYPYLRRVLGWICVEHFLRIKNRWRFPLEFKKIVNAGTPWLWGIIKQGSHRVEVARNQSIWNQLSRAWRTMSCFYVSKSYLQMKY